VDSFKNHLESWQKNSPEKFEYIKTLLAKEPWTKEKYADAPG